MATIQASKMVNCTKCGAAFAFYLDYTLYKDSDLDVQAWLDRKVEEAAATFTCGRRQCPPPKISLA